MASLSNATETWFLDWVLNLVSWSETRLCVHFHFLLPLLTQVIESNLLLCSSMQVKNDRDGMTLCCHGEVRAIMVSRCGS